MAGERAEDLVGMTDGGYARLLLAARIMGVSVAEMVETATDEWCVTHQELLRAAHPTEATILLAGIHD